jgi:hypothetical protein
MDCIMVTNIYLELYQEPSTRLQGAGGEEYTIAQLENLFSGNRCGCKASRQWEELRTPRMNPICNNLTTDTSSPRLH